MIYAKETRKAGESTVIFHKYKDEAGFYWIGVKFSHNPTALNAEAAEWEAEGYKATVYPTGGADHFDFRLTITK
jgi:hypothetical protein